MNVLIVSPHLDDAVLSLGQFMAATRTIVVTVFAGIAEGLSDYDKSCGFDSSTEAMLTRRREDAGACALVGADVVHLDFLDHQYRMGTNDDDIVESLIPFYKSDWVILAPLGIGHPDHVQTARCARVARGDGTMFLYEELPYRVLHPEQVVDEFAKVKTEGFSIADLPYPLEQGPRDRKITAVSAYRSQFPNAEAVLDPCLYVPERVWRVARCA